MTLACTGAYRRRVGPESAASDRRLLRPDSTEHHDTLGVDAEGLSAISFDQPCELHDRSTCRVQDHPLDLLDVTLHAISLAAKDGDLRCRGHQGRIRTRTVRDDSRSEAKRAYAAGPASIDHKPWVPRLSAIAPRWHSSPRLKSCSRGQRGIEATPHPQLAQSSRDPCGRTGRSSVAGPDGLVKGCRGATVGRAGALPPVRFSPPTQRISV